MKYITFADDTTLFSSGPDIKELLTTVEKELIWVKKWFDTNKLSLNENKTKFMVFGGVGANCEIQLILNGAKIERVYETKFLGVILDHKLSWKPHIEYIKQKLSKSIGLIYKTSNFLNKNGLHILYFSLIMPYMTYCVEVWGIHTERIQTL